MRFGSTIASTSAFVDVEELLAAGGVIMTHETVQQWCRKFVQLFANQLRRRHAQPSDKRHYDEVFLKINGKQHYLWRAVDQHRHILDILVQSRRNKGAALKFFRKLLRAIPMCRASSLPVSAPIFEVDPEIAQVVALASDFTEMVRQRQGARLEHWLVQAETSKVAELCSFAATLRKDHRAVKAGLSLPFRNGQTEGQITRLKLLKRMSYGRAGLELLRHRVLYREPPLPIHSRKSQGGAQLAA